MKKNNLTKLLSIAVIALAFSACSSDESAKTEVKTQSVVKEVKKEIVVKEVVKEIAPAKVEVKEAVANLNLGACKGCHGQNFEKSALGKSKIVSDMAKDEVSKALIGYKNGTYGGAMKGMMKAQVAAYSDETLSSTGLGK